MNETCPHCGKTISNDAKIWKASEIKNMSPEDHIKNKDDIMKAMNEGRVQ